MNLRKIVLSEIACILLAGNLHFNYKAEGAEIKRAETNKVIYKTDDFSKDSEEVLLARMLFGEAENCSDLEKVAIAYTAINRVNDGKKWNGETIKEVILKPKQYSCFNEKDPNKNKLKDPETYGPKTFLHCLKISRNVLAGKYNDPTNGATHYHTLAVKPRWNYKKMITIGRINSSKHIFYREK